MKSFSSISLVTVLWLSVGCKAALKGLYTPLRNRQPKIINGENMDIMQAPFMVALTYQGGFKCGGFLIDSQHVLTAYHCLHQIFNAVDVNNAMKYLTVTMIARSKRNPRRYTHKDLEVEEVIPHKYDMDTHVNDIALIKVKLEDDWDDWDVQFVKLPDQNDGRINGREAIAYGWGMQHRMSSNCQSGIIEYSISSEYDVSHIDKVNLTVVDNTSCMKSLKKQLPCASEISNTQMCAVGVNGKDTCKGDSGGPLCIRNDRNEPIAVGIVSYGYGCGNGLPAVYTKISKYTKWIRRHIRY